MTGPNDVFDKEKKGLTFAASLTLSQGEHPALQLTGDRHCDAGSYLKNAQQFGR
jgi:hypothetical protein